ncbi:MAG: T9SS type A sorting domain-containing protein [Flavobacteriales bacterium]|nr:T9SS type A sorting domain-containing protein [Flavobacteriales bacterium]
MKLNSLLALIMATLSSASWSQQYIISATYMNTTPQVTLASVANLPLEYDVETYKIIYNTIDALGNPTIASGAFCIPISEDCSNFPMAVYEHGTSLRKVDVPSYDVQEAYIGKIFSAGGYNVIMPDYIGMGESPGLHPYCHGESEATATLDMIRAVREGETLGLIPGMTQDNGELFLTGYSQGGHAAMATHKYVEDNNLLSEFNILASAPCSGPYEITGAMADTILAASYSNPGYIVYLMASYQSVYGNLYNTYSDILRSPYDEIVVPYFNGNNTSLGMGSLNNQLPTIIQELVVDSVLQNFLNSASDFSHPLWQAMSDNDNHDWVPTRPVRMYYCTGDEQVSFQNALAAEATMQGNGADNVEAIYMGDGMHNECVLPSLSDVYYWFDTLRTPCNTNGLEVVKLDGVEIFPNPVIDELEIQIVSPGKNQIIISDGFGKRVEYIQNVQNSINISMSDYDSGCYFIEVRMKDNSVIQKVIKE